MPDPLLQTDRTRLRRKPGRGSHDRAVVEAILDEALVCHVAFAIDGAPFIIPTTFVRLGDRIVVHGAVASRMLRAMASGVEVAVAVTLLDGLVLARTAFHHSVNYRSVVIFGTATLVEDPEVKRAALHALIEKVRPGRSADCRPPNDKELAATSVIALPIDEASAKIRSGPPLPEEGADAELPYWAGVIPLVTARGTPEPAT
jgi:nitroimidazol reductase NimA-like FMN-containing flavoprotein (pyridoxamine 5'-phosphate oxidase superfamily)